MVYEDGDSEWVLMAMERVRLEVHAAEDLPSPSASDLRRVAEHLKMEAITLSTSEVAKGTLTTL